MAEEKAAPAKSSSVEAEPLHAIAAAHKGDVDPNAAKRAEEGRGPGLQDSEALAPAVWVDDSAEAVAAAEADRLEAAAEQAYKRAKARAAALRKGEPDPYPSG